MANVLNPEPESITLNTELETPTLETATEFEHPSYESTSTPETAEVVTADELATMDADAPTEPVVELAHPVVEVTHVEETPHGTTTVEVPLAEELQTEVSGPTAPEVAPVAKTEHVAPAHAHDSHGSEGMDDFSAALAAFEREQAA